MTTNLPRLLCVGALALLASASVPAADAAVPPPLPAKDVFSLPNVRQPKLSPDGKKIAFLFPYEKHLALGLFDRTTKESRLVLRGEDESLVSFFWKGDDRIVFQADVSGNESLFIGVTDLTGKNVMRLAESQRLEDNLVGTAATLLSPLPGDPDRIAVLGVFADNIDNAMFINAPAIVARLNIRNRARSPLLELRDDERLVPNGSGSIALLVDNAGALRLRGRLVGREVIWEHRLDDGREFKTLARHPFHGYAETWQPLFFGADNVTLYLISREEHDRGALYTLNTRTLQRSAALFVPPEGEIGDLLARDLSAAIIMSPDADRVLGVAYTTDRLRHHWFDPAREALQKKLEGTFKGCEVRITSTGDKEKVALVHVTYDREPGAYFVFDQTAGSLSLFKRVRDLDPARLRPMEPVEFNARDGLALHGYLTRPLAPAGKRVPLVIHPHGGPFGVRDVWGYNADAQFLASLGYAVLQVNYRGSGGYGREFLNQGRQQWGRAMQDDLTDAVKWAIDQGIADPGRVAIYGASYGGYASLAGVTLTPDLYCCAVNYVGAADLEITFKNRGDDAYTRADDFIYQREWVGAIAEYRAATSPLNFVDRIRVPTLHAYGTKDPRVKIDHWSRLEALLKKYGKTYEAIEQKKQGHGFRDEDAAIEFNTRVEKFFASYLAPEGRVNIGPAKTIEMPAKR